MAILQAYGLDNYANLTEFFEEPFWESSGPYNKTFSWFTTGGRFGGGAFGTRDSGGDNGWSMTHWVIEEPSTLFFSASINIITHGATDPWIRFYGDASEHVRLDINTGGTIQVYILGSLQGSFTITESVWHRIEIKVIVDNSIGEFTIKVDEIEEFSLTGVDTLNGTNAFVNRVVLQHQDSGSDATEIDYDDIIFHDDTGATNNDFLGDLRISTLRPNADGDVSNFTPDSGATNYTQVNDGPGADGDTSYVETAGAGIQDLYQVDALPTFPQTIFGVVLRANIKKTDAGSRSVKLLAKSGATTGTGATQPLLTDYENKSEIYEVDPSTSVAWTKVGIDGMQIGMENN